MFIISIVRVISFLHDRILKYCPPRSQMSLRYYRFVSLERFSRGIVTFTNQVLRVHVLDAGHYMSFDMNMCSGRSTKITASPVSAKQGSKQQYQDMYLGDVSMGRLGSL
jgi:hypothetical protein